LCFENDYHKLCDNVNKTVGAMAVQKMDESLSILKKKENECVLKYANFIEQNYKKQRLFYTVNHPSDILMKKLQLDICSLIGINLPFISGTMSHEITPIFKSVRKELEIEFSAENCASKSKFISKKEFIRNYTKFVTFI
jgi:hypothetical protein